MKHINPNRQMAARFSRKMSVKVIANGDAVKVTIPVVNQGTQYYAPVMSWIDEQVRKDFPTAVATDTNEGDTQRLYWIGGQ